MPPDSLARSLEELSSSPADATIGLGVCLLDLALTPRWLRRPHGADPLLPHDKTDRLARSQEVHCLAERALESLESHQCALGLPGAAGVDYFELTLTPLTDPAGQATGVILCALELGHRAQSLAELFSQAKACEILADSTFDWELWIAPKGHLLWVSPSCERVTGYTAAAFMADPDLLFSVVHPEDRSGFIQHLRASPCARPVVQMRFRVLRPSGEVRWVEHVCQAVYWPKGEFAGRRSVNRDVTEAMQVEQALRESENQFRLLFELATVGMVVVEPSTRRLLRVNERLCRILGYEAAELLGLTFNELTHPDDREIDLIRYRRALCGKDTDYFVEKRYLRKDGRVVWAMVNAAFIRDALGEPVRALAAIIDITDRRQAEARARDLAAVVECSSDFIGIADTERRGLYINRAGRLLIGLDLDAPPGDLRIEDFFLPEDLPFLTETVLPALEQNGRWSGELRFRHSRTQEGIPVYYDALRIDDPETGRPLQYATVTRDIRREKAAEQALLEADRRKDAFLATLGHELRNPMSPIRNAVAIIRSIGIGDDPRISWAVDVLDRQTAHMSRLLDDLLDVSRIVRDRIDLDRRDLELRDVVRQAVDGVQSMMQERGHHLVCELPPASLRVEGDPVRLSQILLNVLVNAARYTPDHGEIRVETEVEAGQVRVRVRDNGRGMSAEQIASLLGARSGGLVSPEGFSGGLGLGLGIARRLAELHGGTLEAASAGPGQGTELSLRLPLLSSAPRAAAPKAESPAGVRRSGKPLRLLVVDDNPDVAGALAMLLEIHGYEVATAGSGSAALESIRQNPPRLAFLDIGIPGMDGLELASRLRAEYPQPERLMLVALTGLGEASARERSLAAGFDDHLVKPVEQATLLSLLDRLR